MNEESFIKGHSIERYLKIWIAITGILFISCTTGITLLFTSYWPLVVAIQLCFLLLFRFVIQRPYQRITSVLYRISNGFDAIKNDDFSMSTKSPFSAGICQQVFDEMEELKESIRFKQRCYDERNLLILNLIEQFENPIIVIDERDRIVNGNQAF